MVLSGSHAPATRRAGSRQRFLIALSLLLFLSAFCHTKPAEAQSRPATRWIHGGHQLLAQAVLSPDGATLVTLGVEGTVKIRRTSDGLVLRTIADKLNAGTGELTSLAMSPDGSKIVVGTMESSFDNSQTARVYRVSDGVQLFSWPVAGYYVAGLAWSPDGTKIAVATGGSTDIQLRSATDGSVIRTLSGSSGVPGALAFSPDSTHLLSGGSDVRLWNVSDGTLLNILLNYSPSNTVNAVAYASDNHTVAAAVSAPSGGLHLWNANTGQSLQTMFASTSPSATSLAFSPDATTIAAGLSSSQVQTWSVATGAPLHTGALGPQDTYVTGVMYSSDGSQILAAGFSPEFTYFNAADLTTVRSLAPEYQSVAGIGVTPDGAHVVAVGAGNPSLRSWSLGTGALENLLLNVGNPSVAAFALSPDGTKAAYVAGGNTLIVRQVSDGATLTATSPGLGGTNLAWSKDSTKIYFPTTGGVVKIVNAIGGSDAGTLGGSPAINGVIAISPDGTLLAGAGPGNIVSVWKLSDGTLVSTLAGHAQSVVSLAFSADSSKLVTGSPDGQAILWNVTSGANLHSFSNGSPIVAVAIAPDGQSIAASTPTRLLFWSVATGGLFADFNDEAQGVLQILYTPDAANIVYARSDASVVVAANPAANPAQASLEFSPSSGGAGFSSVGTLTLYQPAPAGGLTFTLTSSSPAVSLTPGSITVPAGATTVTFLASTATSLTGSSATITAISSSSTAVGLLNIRGHLLSDFNSDGMTDLIFQNQSSGSVAVWFTNGLTILGGSIAPTPLSDWKVVGAGDFNRDAKSDLVFQNQTTGQIVIWYMNGTNFLSGDTVSFQPAAGYKVVGVGDFDGDGKPDLLFQKDDTRQLVVWFMQGATVTGGVSIPRIPPAGYKVVGIGDVRGNGMPDIIFQNQTNNQIYIWLMNGTQYVTTSPVASQVQAGWVVQAVTDINGDGIVDLVFQNQTTNQLDAWYLFYPGGPDGNPIFAPDLNTTVIGGGFFSLTPFAGYSLVGPH